MIYTITLVSATLLLQIGAIMLLRTDAIYYLVLLISGLVLALHSRSLLVYIATTYTSVVLLALSQEWNSIWGYYLSTSGNHYLSGAAVLLVYLVATAFATLLSARKGFILDHRLLASIAYSFRMLMDNRSCVHANPFLAYYAIAVLAYSLTIFAIFESHLSFINANEAICITYLLNTVIGFTLSFPLLLYSFTRISIALNFVALATAPFSPGPLLARLLEYDLRVANAYTLCFNHSIGTIEAILQRHPVAKHKYGSDLEWGFQSLEKIPYCINFSSASSPHILVTGSTGSGKTTLAAKIIDYLSRTLSNVSFIIIDPHGEYRYLLKRAKVYQFKSTNRILLLPINETPRDRAYEIVDIVKHLFHIGPIQQHALFEAISGAYSSRAIDIDRPVGEPSSINAPTLRDVIEELGKLVNYYPVDAILSLQRHLELLGLGEEDKDTSLPLIDAMTQSDNGIVVADLSQLRTEQRKYVAAETIMRLIYYSSSQLNKGKKLVLVVDEAHLFAQRGTSTPILAKIVRELRKYGVILLAVTQNIVDLHEEIINNIGFFFSLRTVDAKNRFESARILSGYSETERIKAVERALSSLDQGYAVVKDPYTVDPIIVRLKEPSRHNKY